MVSRRLADGKLEDGFTVRDMVRKQWSGVTTATQAIEILRKLHPISGHGKLLFYGERSHDRPISDNTLRAALLTLGYGPDIQSVHGFRATARIDD